MSALLHIKNIIISRLDMEPKEKAAVMGVLNSIDSDLDEYGYVTTMGTDEAIEYLDQVLTGEDEEETDDVVLERPTKRDRVEEEVEEEVSTKS